MYDFRNSVEKEDILNTREYLMVMDNIKYCLGLLKIVFCIIN